MSRQTVVSVETAPALAGYAAPEPEAQVQLTQPDISSQICSVFLLARGERGEEPAVNTALISAVIDLMVSIENDYKSNDMVTRFLTAALCSTMPQSSLQPLFQTDVTLGCLWVKTELNHILHSQPENC